MYSSSIRDVFGGFEKNTCIRGVFCEYSVVYYGVFIEYIGIHQNTYKYHNDTKGLESIQMDTSEYGQNTRIF